MENKRIKILHVDDERNTLKVVKKILEKEGYYVDSVEGGIEALEKIEFNNYDLILLDIMMSDMSGWDLFTQILTINSDYKVMFLTVLDVTEERLSELKKHGVKGYMTKPFDIGELIEEVNRIVSSST